MLNPQDGIVRYAPNMPGWENVPFARLLSQRLGEIPVFIENDGNLGVLGEQALGAAVGCRDVIGIFVGTGIGGGLILDGKLWEGSHKTAAEIGHMIVMADGPVCGCGARGCIEALASRTAIERDIWAGIKARRESLVPEIMKRDERDRMTSGVLAEAYAAGDALVMEVIGRAEFYLGLTVASVINFVDPQIVVFGGGVVEALGDGFLEPIRRTAYQYVMNKQDVRQIKIVTAQLGDNAAMLGAAVYRAAAAGERLSRKWGCRRRDVATSLRRRCSVTGWARGRRVQGGHGRLLFWRELLDLFQDRRHRLFIQPLPRSLPARSTSGGTGVKVA